jgi:vancomycin resistance protein YoaR
VDDYVSAFDDVNFTLSVGDKSVTADTEDIGLCAKNSDVVERALKYGQEGNPLARYKAVQDMANGKEKDFALSLTSDTATVETFLENNKTDLVTEAVDNTVKLVDGEFVYVEGTEGVELLTGKSAVAIADFIATQWDGKDAEIELLTQKDVPRGTKEELSTIQDVLGAYDTNFGTVVNGRTNNIKVGASKLDGIVLYPGETISVGDAIGPTTEENGYFLAGSYENGTTVETYGGGICQVSTTLYNAVIRAELEVVTRAAHSMIVTYVEPSMDAAIADGVKDFQFKNNQETPIYIQAYTSNGNLYFAIYGKETRDPGREVEFISEVTSQTDPEIEYNLVADQPIGYIETTTKSHTGYTAQLWKVVTQDGVEVSRDVINHSTYSPSNEIVSVGIATDNPEAAAAVTAAVETKDDAVIRETIANWSAEAIAARAQAEADAAAQAAAAAAAASGGTTTTPSGSEGTTSTGETSAQ